MSSPFAARRKARVIGQDEEHSGGTVDSGSDAQGKSTTTLYNASPSDARRPSRWLTARVDNGPTVKRPTFKPKKRSSLRLSFGPGGGTSMTEDDSSASEVFTPKKSNLSRQAIEKNALRKSHPLAHSLSSEHLPFRSQNEERPSYSRDHLEELKSSTPSTPIDLKTLSNAEKETGQALDIASKFGTDLSLYANPSIIPTDAEIQEKKARRARLAKEAEYISLHADERSDSDASENEKNIRDPNSDISDTEFRTSVIRAKKLDPVSSRKPHKRKEQQESRLVPEDEDIAEGFDDFVSDGRIALGRKAEREARRRRKEEMKSMIEDAEGSGDEDSEDDSEAERRVEFEAAQTRAGMDGLHHSQTEQRWEDERYKTPPRITPLPTITQCLEKLRAKLAALEYSHLQKVRVMEGIDKERADIKVREEEIQALLKEAGERYEKLRAEVDGVPLNDEVDGKNGLRHMGRGLESIGSAVGTPVRGGTPALGSDREDRNGDGEEDGEEEGSEMDIDERPRFGL